jgi:spore coat-associated protein N
MRAGSARSRRFLTTALVLVFAVVLLGLVSIRSSEARFAVASSNPGAVFSSGTMTLVNSRDGSAVISATGLAPGASVIGTLTLTSQGDLGADVTLTNTAITDQPAAATLSTALTLKIENTTGTAVTLYNSTMSAFTSVSLGRFDPEETRTYRFTLTFPTANAISSRQGSSTSMTIRFSGVAQ